MYGVPAVGMGAAQAAVTPSSSGQYSTQTVVPPVATGAMDRRPKPPKAKPKKKKGTTGGVPGINQYLAGDTTYQDQQSQLMKQLEDFKTSNASQSDMVNQDFATALAKMQQQKTQDEGNITGDYAARGLLNSGLFTKSVGDYDTNYQNQYNDLTTGKTRSLNDLLEALQNTTTENSSALAAAKQDAIRRRAQKYGITT